MTFIVIGKGIKSFEIPVCSRQLCNLIFDIRFPLKLLSDKRENEIIIDIIMLRTFEH